MKKLIEWAMKLFIYLALLLGFSLIFMVVPGCCMLINAYLKLPSVLTLAITFIWSFIILSFLHYCHKNYFNYFDEENIEYQQLIDNKEVYWKAKDFHQVLKFFMFSIVSRIVILGVLLSSINFVLLPSLVLDLQLLSECQQNVSIYGLLLGLLFIALSSIVLNRQNKNEKPRNSFLF